MGITIPLVNELLLNHLASLHW